MTISNTFLPDKKKPSVFAAVYLGSKSGHSPIYKDCAIELGKQLAIKGI